MNLIRALGPDILEAGGRHLLSRASPFLANKLLDASEHLRTKGYDLSKVVDKTLNYFTENQDRIKDIALNTLRRGTELRTQSKIQAPRVMSRMPSYETLRQMDRPAPFGGDTSVNGYRSPDSGIYKNSTMRMPANLFAPDSTPYIIGDEKPSKATSSQISRDMSKQLPMDTFKANTSKPKKTRKRKAGKVQSMNLNENVKMGVKTTRKKRQPNKDVVIIDDTKPSRMSKEEFMKKPRGLKIVDMTKQQKMTKEEFMKKPRGLKIKEPINFKVEI